VFRLVTETPQGEIKNLGVFPTLWAAQISMKRAALKTPENTCWIINLDTGEIL
jgi:hypothetical protein